MEKQFQSFEEFWPFYLSQHADGICRALHVVGTTAGVAFLILCLVSANFALIPLSLVPGYGLAWVGHFVFEKNRPAAFGNPIWSLFGDFKMLRLVYTGQINDELKRLNITPASK